MPSVSSFQERIIHNIFFDINIFIICRVLLYLELVFDIFLLLEIFGLMVMCDILLLRIRNLIRKGLRIFGFLLFMLVFAIISIFYRFLGMRSFSSITIVEELVVMIIFRVKIFLASLSYLIESF